MFEIGTILDKRYQIQAHLGAGGMGEVYRVLDLEQDRECALKILNTMVDQKAVHRRFHREFQVLNRFEHPRLVRTFAWGFAEERPYFTMEYLPGKTLEKMIADRARLGQFRASYFFALMRQIVEGLAYIHAQGAVHRDLKPSNIMVLETEEGIETTILDLGLAKFRHLHSVSITQTGATIGTAEYMSPEQGKGLWVDHRSDLYSLGVILYEMLLGMPPFSGQNPVSVILKHIREIPPSMGEVHIAVPEETQQIVLKLLAKEPVDRYQSAEEVVQALNGVASSGFVLSDDEQRDVPVKVMRPQFVGRESEMKLLRAMFKDVQAGEQRVVLISGEAGVGKTRLIEELLGDALIHDFLCLKGVGREEGGQIYGALIDAFQGVKTTDLVEKVPDSLETDKFSVMERWLQLLKRLRQKQPVVLCLEDIQWLDELTLEFLQYVLRDSEPCPFLLCLTCRWSNLEPLSGEVENFIHSNEFAEVTRIQLEDLPREEVGYLAASMLGERSIPEDALQTLFRETGGQPLFVVEAVRTLINADVVRQNVYGDWQWGDFPEALLSDDISEVLYRRITTLSAVQRQVMEYACVFLNDFSFELLAAIWLGDELELLDVLEGLIEEGLLITYGDEERYRFSQGLYRRAIYDRMQNVRRRLLHREIGNALEGLEDAEELTEELADHFAAAGEQNKAVKYMRLSGKKALKKHAYRQARMRFEAVQLMDDAFESQVDEIEFLCDYADALRNCGQYNRALKFLEEAQALLPADRNDLKTRILTHVGIIHSVLQNGEVAEEYMLEALQLYRELGDLDGEIQALSSLAYLCDVSGRHEEALAYMRREIEKRHILGNPENEVFIQGREGQAALMGFQFETAKAHLKAVVKTSQKFGREYQRIEALNLLQRVYFYLGNFNRAEAVCYEVIGEWQKRGFVYWEAVNFLYLGELALERGDFSEALEYAETSAERFLQTPRRDYVYRAYAIAATAAAKMGDTEGALEWAERASEGTQQTSGMFTGILPLVYCGIGAALAQAERITEAEEAFEQAIECRRESKGDPWARALLMAGEFYLERGDVPKTQEYLESAKQAFEEMEMSYFFEKTQVLLNQLDESSRSEDAAPGAEILCVDRWRLLYEVSRELTTERDVKVLLDRILGNLLTVYPAERVLVAIKNKTPKGFVVDAVRYYNVKADDAEALSRGIIRRVIETNEPVLSMDAQIDQRLNCYQSVIDYHIRSVLSVPVFHLNEGVMGALYIDHRGIDNAFSKADQTFLQAFANLVGMALVNARMYEQLEEKAQYLQQQVERRHQLGDMFGQSDAMQAIYRLIERAASSDVPVLVQGETGTGKELAARAIHYNSRRKDQRFLSQNCATLSPELLQSELFGHKKGAFTGASEDHTGIFEAADGGTVFLDEIGDAPPQLQRSLLRVLQEGEIRRVGETEDREVDVRIIAATNRDLKKEVEEGSFREDLYYRLHVIQIDMPPLREYLEDVPLLAEHLLIRAKEEANKPVGGLTVGAIRALTNYDWPGNVRELENEIRRAVALAEEEGAITPDLFSESIGHTVPDVPVEYQGRLQDHVQEYERRLIRAALEKCKGNITHTARELGMTRVGLHKKINRLGLR
ncbi:MAG: sigma 54-interacting transcriptional regulator [Gemmatimonadetes bacterium]|nr:sigma 54-interacting transcriptional regulator [Gemmatimonadota bacterium]